MTFINDNSLKLDCAVGKDGIIHLSASGKLTNTHLEEFSAWADKIKTLISTKAAEGVDPILVLVDIKSLVHYERKPIEVLRDLLRYDKQFPIRTAIVGASQFAALLFDALISILTRSNIRQFHSESEALLWLHAAKRSAK